MRLNRLFRSSLATAGIMVGLAMVIASFAPWRWWHGLPVENVTIAGHRFYVQVAQTPEDRAKGLMGHDSLNPEQGMLFVYPDEAPRHFWMKNTTMPLDILFFDHANRLIGVAQATPCTADPCTVYSSPGPAQFVVELSAGTVDREEIGPGAQLIQYVPPALPPLSKSTTVAARPGQVDVSDPDGRDAG